MYYLYLFSILLNDFLAVIYLFVFIYLLFIDVNSNVAQHLSKKRDNDGIEVSFFIHAFFFIFQLPGGDDLLTTAAQRSIFYCNCIINSFALA